MSNLLATASRGAIQPILLVSVDSVNVSTDISARGLLYPSGVLPTEKGTGQKSTGTMFHLEDCSMFVAAWHSEMGTSPLNMNEELISLCLRIGTLERQLRGSNMLNVESNTFGGELLVGPFGTQGE